jgi:Nucleotide-diphospho-sugar transferase
MVSDRATNNGSTTEPRSIPSIEAKASIRAELAGPFMWPSSLTRVTRPLEDLSGVMDLGKLTAVAAAANDRKEIIFTLISKEYIQTGLNWVHAMQRIGLSNFLIIAGDTFTSETLGERGVPSVRADIDESEFDPSFVSHDGFSSKGLAMIALKFPVTSFLLKCGYSVTFSDSDAVWLQDPMPYLRGPDIAFQRVAHHPPPISSLWSFAACTGFVFVRPGTRTIAFLDRCIIEHKSFRCDQVAMNLALLEGNPDWLCEDSDWMPPGGDVQYDKDQRLATFAKLMRFPIKGELRQDGLQLLALPHDKFWRHLWVTRSMPDMVICHPNSPKVDLEKMKIFDAMGIHFPPEAADLTRAGERDHGAD